jgi:PAS domain-containing protein
VGRGRTNSWLDYFFYTALTAAALDDNASADEQAAWRDLLAGHREQLREWADTYLPTFADKHALVSAEIARLDGRNSSAMRLYEQAIQAAREHGFVQNEGIAHELATGFCLARGWTTAGRALLTKRAAALHAGDLASGRMRWTYLTRPEWLDRDNQRIAELRTPGTLQPFAKEYFRKDGSRAPVLIGVAMFEAGESQGVGLVLDLTGRKRAEAEARESERRYREVQMALVHSNRAATMGQLTASIAHEVKQPITR